MSEVIEWSKLSMRERDETVVGLIFGTKKCPVHHSFGCCGHSLKAFSTDLTDAWTILDSLSIDWTINVSGGCCEPTVEMYHSGQDWQPSYEGVANSVPEAICIAALRAKGYLVQVGKADPR